MTFKPKGEAGEKPATPIYDGEKMKFYPLAMAAMGGVAVGVSMMLIGLVMKATAAKKEPRSKGRTLSAFPGQNRNSLEDTFNPAAATKADKAAQDYYY